MSWGIGNVGGSDLNFLIRKYNSEGELPKTAPNNTIAIITSEKITDWFFSPKMFHDFCPEKSQYQVLGTLFPLLKFQCNFFPLVLMCLYLCG